MPDYFPVLSEHLSEALDEIGVSRSTVKQRRQSRLIRENIVKLSDTLLDQASIERFFYGSQSEGTTTLGLNSDADILTVINRMRVIQDWSDWKQDMLYVLMLQENTAPGYCRLQVLRDDLPLPVDFLPHEHCTFDGSGRVLLKNTAFCSISNQGDVLNGPAVSTAGTRIVRASDRVNALKCESWPKTAQHWSQRQRKDWPTERLVREGVSGGCFVVPVGYRLSDTKDLEWRISFSYTERLLVFSINVIMLKCYVLLKMIVKRFITPFAGESISSYHCKTALFYCIEETGCKLWRKESLLECISLCLKKLLTWLSNEHCPHYIIPESNLFAGKITHPNKDRVCDIIHAILDSRGRYLMEIHFDELGPLIQSKLTGPPLLRTIDDTCYNCVIVANEHMQICNKRNQAMVLLQVHNLQLDSLSLVFSLHQKLSTFAGVGRSENRYEHVTTRSFTRELMCQLGSLMGSISISYNRRIPTEALRWFIKGAGCDVASLLKLASALYNGGQFHQAKSLLGGIEERILKGDIVSICGCYRNRCLIAPKYLVERYANLSDRLKAIAKRMARCVIFSPQEIHYAPPALRSELLRLFVDDIQHRDPKEDQWMALAVADSVPFLYYLQYLTYARLGQVDLQARALLSLENTVRGYLKLSHLETAWNLLGQCMELEHRPEAAADCYRTSLEIRPRNNAAIWHVQNLCYRRIRGDY